MEGGLMASLGIKIFLDLNWKFHKALGAEFELQNQIVDKSKSEATS